MKTPRDLRPLLERIARVKDPYIRKRCIRMLGDSLGMYEQMQQHYEQLEPPSDERQRKVLAYLSEHKTASAEELAEYAGCSREDIWQWCWTTGELHNHGVRGKGQQYRLVITPNYIP